MRRINSPDQQFHDGDPSQGVVGTLVSASWLNQVQEEIATVIEGAGITLDPAKTNQLEEAIRSRVGQLNRPAQRLFLSMMRK
ncbi:hypothetical protein QWZ03_18310 [Chitinimonas viridis]|uniref:Peptidylprolyl isomerase n=1 Tax=Chitinimonas viridis TaxID=664880 RepID=A0ABT8B905_9NEIS|nr:hypothetical protein [Chitinimonas viridis]MDN3578724.1 hypothetical protein [Chitinimonas viridis]